MNGLNKLTLGYVRAMRDHSIPSAKGLNVWSLKNYNKITNMIKKIKPTKLNMTKLHLGGLK